MTEYASTPEELAQARAALDVDPPTAAAYRRMHADDELLRFLLRALERSEARRALYRRHHPQPLPIDGHAYARRRRRR